MASLNSPCSSTNFRKVDSREGTRQLIVAIQFQSSCYSLPFFYVSISPFIDYYNMEINGIKRGLAIFLLRQKEKEAMFRFLLSPLQFI